MYWALILAVYNEVDVCAYFNRNWSFVQNWANAVAVCNRLDVCSKGGPIGRYHLSGSRATNVQLVDVCTQR